MKADPATARPLGIKGALGATLPTSLCGGEVWLPSRQRWELFRLFGADLAAACARRLT